MADALLSSRMDPSLFSPDAIEPETAELNRYLEEFARDRPHVSEAAPADVRRAREEGNSAFGDIVTSERAVTRTIPGPAGDIPVRIIRPAGEARGLYLHLHGGGWVLGAAHHRDVRNQELADATGLITFSVDYRLAPEHPYPAGPDDCEAAALWLAEHGPAALGAEMVAIGGESAGAHLALVTMLRMRDRHGFRGFRAADLIYGVYDLRMTPSARRWGDRPLVLDTKAMEWFTGHFLPEPELAEDPDVSPLLADLTGLPPALFTVGTADPLIDDTLFCYSRYVAAGNSAGLAIEPGAPHGFDAFDVPVSRRARGRINGFLVSALAG